MMFDVEGYHVIAVESAEVALARMRATQPDLVVTDVKLTGMDGFTFFEQVREDNTLLTVPFVFITGYNDPHAIAHVRTLGASGYVTKPYDLEDLLRVVKKILPATTSS